MSNKVYWVTECSEDSMSVTHHLFSTKRITKEDEVPELNAKIADFCSHIRAMEAGRYLPLFRVEDGIEAHEFVKEYEAQTA